MARCCGSTGTCACKVQAGERIAVVGSGSSQDPFVISADLGVAVVDNTQFNLSITGAGTVADPYAISVAYAATATLSGIPDVSTTTPTNGQVLAYNTTTHKWGPVAPTTAASGSVNTDTSLTGDGSVGLPLQVLEDPDGGLVTGASGLGLSVGYKNMLNRKFATVAARTAASPTPTLNTLSTLDTSPGVLWFWDGLAWQVVQGKVGLEVDSGQLLALSGPYVNTPTTLLIKQFSITTDTLGEFEALSVGDLSGWAGVLGCHIQPVGANGFSTTVEGSLDHVQATAYTLDTGTIYDSQSLQGTIFAYLY